MISQLPACRLDEHAVDDEVPGMVLVLEAEQSRAEQRGLVRHIHSSMAALHHWQHEAASPPLKASPQLRGVRGDRTGRRKEKEGGSVSPPGKAVQPALFCFLKGKKRIADLFLPPQISYLDGIFGDTHSVWLSDTEETQRVCSTAENGSV